VINSPFCAYEPLSKRTIEIMMKVVADRAGIDPKRVWPHVLRHSYCTHLLQRNVSPAKVMQLLGHSSMEMVMTVYNQLRPADSMDDVLRALSD
jgi:integrase/recombinase XerD